MYSASKAGKIIGILFLVQIVIGIFINFSALPQLFAEPGYMMTGADNLGKFGTAAIVALFMNGIGLLVACFVYPIFKERSPVLSLMVVALPVVCLALTGLEYSRTMEMASFSQHYLAATSADAKAMLEAIKPVISSGRNWAHYMAVGFSGFSLFLLYLLMFRSSATPRLLAGYGMLAAVSQQIAVAHPFLGNSVPFVMLAPLALAQLALPIYFIVKGISVKDELAA